MSFSHFTVEENKVGKKIQYLAWDHTNSNWKSTFQTRVFLFPEPTLLLLYCFRLKKKASYCDKELVLALKRGHGKFLLKKKKQQKTSSCYLAGGGWKTSKQFLEHDNYASCFSSGEMAKQKLTKFQEEKKKKKDHLWAQNKLEKFQPKGWAGECYRLLRHRLVIMMPLFDHYSEVGALGQAGCTWRSDGPEIKWQVPSWLDFLYIHC